MKQPSLFEDEDSSLASPVLVRSAPAITGSRRTLSAAQRRFNDLIARIAALRAERERWQQFAARHAARVVAELMPAAARLRDTRVVLAKLLERHLGDPQLGKRARAALREQLLALVLELLEEEETAELVALYDRYADRTLAEEERLEFEVLRTVASGLDIDVEAYDGAENPEAFSEWVYRKVEEPPRVTRRARRRTPAAAEAAPSGTGALRAVFRRLASALHPDRESDPAQHQRKTALMQELNAAYARGDLLRVLELQQSIDARAVQALGGLSDAELQPYLQLLETQARELRQEIEAFKSPFADLMPGRSVRTLTPELVERSLAQTVAQITQEERLLAADLECLADVRELKARLQGQRRTDSSTPRSRGRGKRRRAPSKR